MNYISTTNITAVSRLFSSSVIKEFARLGRSPLFTRLLGEIDLLNSSRSYDQVRDVFDDAFSVLKQKANRHEYVYKSAITQNILFGKHSLNTASMLTEFRVGECKADVVILNGTGTVYEIKSERDSLSRLAKQIEAYRDVFAKVYVIAGENHIDTIFSTVPDDVGIKILSKNHNISEKRAAIDLPERTKASVIFDSIRINEAEWILKNAGVECPKVPNTEKYHVYKELFSMLPSKDAHCGMVRALKQTRNLLPLKSLVSQLPVSLRSAALTTPIRKMDQQKLVDAVNTPFNEALKWT